MTIQVERPNDRQVQSRLVGTASNNDTVSGIQPRLFRIRYVTLESQTQPPDVWLHNPDEFPMYISGDIWGVFNARLSARSSVDVMFLDVNTSYSE